MAFVKKLRLLNKKRIWARHARWAAARKKKLLSFGSFALGVLANTRQGLFVVDPEDGGVSKELLRNGVYSQLEVDLISTQLNSTDTVLLVGAHIGALAVPMSRICQTVIAIEANPETYQFLLANLKLNDCQNVKAYNFAAGEHEGVIDFIANKDNSGGSKRKPVVDDVSFTYDSPNVYQVPLKRLGTEFADQRIDFVFMDIEGSEYFALSGMPYILEQARTLVVEFQPHHLDKVAGVSVEQFYSVIAPYFEWMYIPAQKRIVAKNDTLAELTRMHQANEVHEGLVFQKLAPRDQA
jgi:FkbM family methyltransferase